MTCFPRTFWFEARLDTLRGHIAQRKAYATIAQEMGCTASAVRGAIHYYGLGPRAQRAVGVGPVMKPLLAEVAAQYGITAEDIKGRGHRYSEARQDFMARAYDAGKSFPAIGKFLDGRDHTTIIFGVRSHRARQALLMLQEAA